MNSLRARTRGTDETLNNKRTNKCASLKCKFPHGKYTLIIKLSLNETFIII